MRFRTPTLIGCALVAAVLWAGTSARAQRSGLFRGSLHDPAIAYTSGALDNAIDTLNKRVAAGTARLSFQGRSGYLQSVLAALNLPVDSQLLVFSNGSLQRRRIDPNNPRAIFFNDRVQLGWVRDGDLLEVAALDARQGVVFYTLAQTDVAVPRFERETRCLGCHMNRDTLGVPGLLMFSSTPGPDRAFSSTIFMDHTMPVASRFGGWFVTGALAPAHHKGNDVSALDGRPSRDLASTEGLYDADGYPSSSSDIASLMVLSHQVGMVNRLVRAGWEARAADPTLHPDRSPDSEALLAPLLQAAADDVVDGLLFIDEAPLDGPIKGSSGFAERFAAEGPQDKAGRSLRQLDLTHRLMRYRCSYVIYSPLFDGLPSSMKSLVYERLWRVLSGDETDVRYRTALSLTDRQAIIEILRDTKPGLPPYFQPITR